MSQQQELQAMVEKARRYLSSAEVLRQNQDYDSAVSRLYYAMFYCAEALLLSKSMAFSSHKAVISAFGRHFAKANLLPVDMHRWLLDGFGKRQVSDYEFITRNSDSDVADLQSKAEQFVAKTEEYLRNQGFVQ